MCWVGEDGRKKYKVGLTDKGESQKLADHLEEEARKIREGTLDIAERSRREAALSPIASHCRDYHEDLGHRESTTKHANRSLSVLLRIFDAARIESVSDLAPDRIRVAIGQLRIRPKGAKGKATDKPVSARTKNFYIATVKAFIGWLADSNRIGEIPKGFRKLGQYNVKEDRRLIRRAITEDEMRRLYDAVEKADRIEATRGPRTEGRRESSVRYLSGPERAAIYRIAMGTGFRAQEIRTLTPERFHLDGPSPSITVLACYAKNGKEAVQPITEELADAFRPFLEGKPAGQTVLLVPFRAAHMLRNDLALAGIPPVDSQGRVVDFHALRGSYITHLIRSGANPKIVQSLARHSTITLTLDTYTSLDEGEARAALAKLGNGKPKPDKSDPSNPEPPDPSKSNPSS